MKNLSVLFLFFVGALVFLVSGCGGSGSGNSVPTNPFAGTYTGSYTDSNITTAGTAAVTISSAGFISGNLTDSVNGTRALSGTISTTGAVVATVASSANTLNGALTLNTAATQATGVLTYASPTVSYPITFTLNKQ